VEYLESARDAVERCSVNRDTPIFLSLIEEHLNKGMRVAVPEYAKDCVTNEKGYSYFSHHGKVDAMNYSTAVFLINDQVRALYVVYGPLPQDDGEYGKQQIPRYLVKTLDTEIEVGDYVIVPATVGHRMQIAKVVDTEAEIDFDSTTVVPWIIQRVDLDAFNQTIKQEKVAISKIREAAVMEKKKKLAQSLQGATSIDLRALPLATKPEKGRFG
jgi:hypothetical protein